MKSISRSISLIALLALVLFSGCKEEELTLDAPYSKLEGINGSFRLNAVTQVDELTSSTFNEMDLSSFFVRSTPMTISFDNSTMTYAVANADSLPNYLGASGSWAFDDPEYPSSITLTTSMGESVNLALGQTIRPIESQLIFSVERGCNGGKAISYRYTFDRAQ